jgi:RND family efflux transporter MFP subunit
MFTRPEAGMSMKPIAFAVLPALAAVLAACEREGNTFVAPPPPEVTVMPVAATTVTNYDEFTGRTEALENVEIRARVRGFLESMHFEPGTPVEQGALLFQIEAAPFQAKVDSAKAEVAKAEAAAGLAEVTLEKTREAAAKGAVTPIEMKQREAEFDAAQAAVQAAEAEVKTAELDLSYTTVRSPLGGRVSREQVSVGNLVGANEATLLTSVALDDPIYVYFSLDERLLMQYLRAIGDRNNRERDRAEQPAELVLIDGTDYEHVGIVDFGENRIDSATGSLEVRATFPNPQGMLVPGQFARVRVPTNEIETMLVPEIALGRDQVGPFLLIVNDQNEVERRDVVLGRQMGRQRMIQGGLQAGDRVIVRGLQRARPGITVKAEVGEPPAPPTPGDVTTPADPEPGEDGAPAEAQGS